MGWMQHDSMLEAGEADQILSDAQKEHAMRDFHTKQKKLQQVAEEAHAASTGGGAAAAAASASARRYMPMPATMSQSTTGYQPQHYFPAPAPVNMPAVPPYAFAAHAPLALQQQQQPQYQQQQYQGGITHALPGVPASVWPAATSAAPHMQNTAPPFMAYHQFHGNGAPVVQQVATRQPTVLPPPPPPPPPPRLPVALGATGQATALAALNRAGL